MENFWSSLSKWFNEKTSSPLYFTYFGFFVLWNWQLFQIVFLEDASLFSSPRIEYIEKHILFNFTLFKISFINSIFLLACNLLWKIVPPVLMTYLAIEYLPEIHRWAFKIHTKDYFERKSLYRKSNLQFEQEKTELLKEEAVQAQVQATQKQIIESNLSEGEKWLIEYEDVQNNSLLSDKFEQLIDVMYKHDGFISDDYNNRYIDSDFLGFAHSTELISFAVGSKNNRIQLTEKGKFFVRQFLSNKNSIPF